MAATSNVSLPLSNRTTCGSFGGAPTEVIYKPVVLVLAAMELSNRCCNASS